MILKTLSLTALASFASLTLSSTAMAQAPSECDHELTGAVVECLRAKSAVATKQMNTLLEAHRATLRKNLATEIERRLGNSQMAWEAFRIAECALESSEFLGGAYEQLLYVDCELERTQKRVKQLQNLSF